MKRDPPPFITRVVLRNWRSIAHCDVRLGPLTYLVGPNGSGKSNFLDALHFVRDALAGTLEQALTDRGGLHEVLRRSASSFGIRLDFRIGERNGSYAFEVGYSGGSPSVPRVIEEACSFANLREDSFRASSGKMVNYDVAVDERNVHVPPQAMEQLMKPRLSADRLALFSLGSSTIGFWPVLQALAGMGFYNFDPVAIREAQAPQDGRMLKPTGTNLASVMGHLQSNTPTTAALIRDYLRAVVPDLESVEHVDLGPYETLRFRMQTSDTRIDKSFHALNMSDGTLRSLAVLVALFQGDNELAPRLVGIEEPETALHPGASAVLRDALNHASDLTQVIVTSHSPDLLDDPDLLPDTLRPVMFEQGTTRIAEPDTTSLDMLRRKLFTAGELLRLGQLVPNETTLARQRVAESRIFEPSAP